MLTGDQPRSTSRANLPCSDVRAELHPVCLSAPIMHEMHDLAPIRATARLAAAAAHPLDAEAELPRPPFAADGQDRDPDRPRGGSITAGEVVPRLRSQRCWVQLAASLKRQAA